MLPSTNMEIHQRVCFLFTIKVRLGAKTFAAIVRTLGPILSRPVDFFTFKLVRIFFTKVTFVNGMVNSVLLVTLDST